MFWFRMEELESSLTMSPRTRVTAAGSWPHPQLARPPRSLPLRRH
jgi:hypothetical protein